MKKNFLILLLIAMTVIVGFLRDYIFVFINHIIETGADVSGHFSMFKWILTGLFSILYMTITCAFLFLLFRSRKYIRIAIGVYAAIFIAAFFIGGIGSILTSFGKIYPFVRVILGIAQSPIVMMILIPGCFLNQAKVFDKN